MKFKTTEEQLAELTVRHNKMTKAMASLEEPSLLSFEWVKENILQIKEDEG